MISRLRHWYRGSTFAQAASGALARWAALPPLGWEALAWIAPVWWILLARREALPGLRPYRALWVAGFLFWMATLHFLRLPHWTTSFGWIGYLPVFVGLVRVAVHRLDVPVIAAAPVVWTGLELARGHLITGFTMASLGHTQYEWLPLIQISDVAGAYGVGFVIMFAAACLGRMLPCDGRGPSLWPLVPAAAMLAAVLGYGHYRLIDEEGPPTARVALIQGSIDAELKSDPEKNAQVLDHYFTLSREALRRDAPLDLIVWPETMFRDTLITFDPNPKAPEASGLSNDIFREQLDAAAWRSRRILEMASERFEVPAILGIDTFHYGEDGPRRFNSAVFLDTSGEIRGRYDKMHLVLFGEYIPFGNWFPALQRLTPLPVNLDPGLEPQAFEVGRLRYAPSICFETVLPHVIRRQVLELGRRGREPDVLVNLTNDGWFRGSSELDLHLICGIFRAVECRKPLLIAANTGFSAWIDGDGRVRAQGPRRKTAALLAEVRPEGRTSWYLAHGDLFAGTCLVATLGFAAAGLWGRWRRVIGSQ